MHRLRSFVPSANYLFAFEAAAWRLSFTAAAGELNESQPAVSKTIRLLEEATGLKLFKRDRGQLQLTTEGSCLRIGYCSERQPRSTPRGGIVDPPILWIDPYPMGQRIAAWV